MPSRVAPLCLALVFGVSCCGALAAQQEQTDANTLQEIMARAEKLTQPGPGHRALERFLGDWDVETRLVLGQEKRPAETGTCHIEWLMDGRWLKLEIEGTLMGKPMKGFTILGFDNFKKSYVMTTVQSMDTAMLRAEGDMTPGAKALILYGAMDEYLTGEHDKMVKYVWRFEGDDEMVLEIHDLAIGETNTMVIEQTMTRKQ